MTELDKLIIKAKKGDAEAQHLIAFKEWVDGSCPSGLTTFIPFSGIK